ncbi:MAG: hypothetical protein Q8N84_00760 [bacterium]|nr:hypothetical protein [bacterium]
MKSIFSTIILISLISLLPHVMPLALAAEEVPVLLFDSSNHYLGACQQTDASEWILDKDLPVTLFQIWYNWLPSETELEFTVTKDGEDFLSGTATRTACDTYQKNWCNADFVANLTFPKGTYTTKVDNARQCLVPTGTGVVRLYGSNVEEEKISTPAARPQPTPPPQKPEGVPLVTEPPFVPQCTCPAAPVTTYIFTAIGGLALGAILVLLFKR